MRSISLFITMATLLLAGSAQAATINVANSCVGAPMPCTTDLQGALDNTSYSRVEILANQNMVGDFVITRGLTLAGKSNASVTRPTGSSYALRVEGTSAVNVVTLAIDGRVAVYDSSDVDFIAVDVASGDIGFQILDSDDVLIRTTVVTASDRGVDVLDSTNVSVVGGDIDGGDYGVVLSSSDIDFNLGAFHGDTHGVVLQDGNAAAYPSLYADGSTITASGSNDEVWRWTRGSATYVNMSPVPSQHTSSSSSLVSLLGYTPIGGD